MPIRMISRTFSPRLVRWRPAPQVGPVDQHRPDAPSMTTSTCSPTASTFCSASPMAAGVAIEVVAAVVRHRDRDDSGVDDSPCVIHTADALEHEGSGPLFTSPATWSHVAGGVFIHS